MAKKPKTCILDRSGRSCAVASPLSTAPTPRNNQHTQRKHTAELAKRTHPPANRKKPHKQSPLCPVSAMGGEALRCGSPEHILRPSFSVLSMRLITIHLTTKQTMNSQNKSKKAQRRTLNVQNQDMHMFSFPLSVSREAWPLAEKKKKINKCSVRGYSITSVHTRQGIKRKSRNENACSLCGSFGGRCCSSARPPCWSCEILWECPVVGVVCVGGGLRCLPAVCDVFVVLSFRFSPSGGWVGWPRVLSDRVLFRGSDKRFPFPTTCSQMSWRATHCVFAVSCSCQEHDAWGQYETLASASPPCPEEVQQTVGILRPLPCDPHKAAVSGGGRVSALPSVSSCLRSGQRGKK